LPKPMTTENEKAKAWRRSLGLTLDELAALTGYSREAVHLFERGRNSLGRPHAPYAWRRYKLACLAATVLRRHNVPSVDQWGWRS
jgi:transcriptional regulator with XRE-family HTH domain